MVIFIARKFLCGKRFILNIHHWLIFLFFKPFLPCFFRFCCQKLFGSKSIFQGKLTCSITHQHHVRCLFHNQSGNRNWMHNILHGSYRTTISQLIHDTCVQGHMSIPVGISTFTNCRILQVSFRNFNTLLNSIERTAIIF